jgi:hypothetical protein
MSHGPHVAAINLYHSSSSKAESQTVGSKPDKKRRRQESSDQSMEVIRQSWSQCNDKNTISLVNIMGGHGYGVGKVSRALYVRHVVR